MTLKVTADFETGHGKDVRVEHDDVYLTCDFHFHVAITNHSDEATETTIHGKFPQGRFLRGVSLAGRTNALTRSLLAVSSWAMWLPNNPVAPVMTGSLST